MINLDRDVLEQGTERLCALVKVETVTGQLLWLDVCQRPSVLTLNVPR